MSSAATAEIPVSLPRSRFRKFNIGLLISGVLIIVAIFSLMHPLHDFVEYWTTSHLLLAQENPYGIAEVARMEHALGFEQLVPIMLLSPPMILPFIAPIGLFSSYALACFLWVGALMALVAVSSRFLMDVYFGALRLPDISDTGFYRGLFAFTFYPVLLCLKFTQTAPFLLLGAAGFLYFESRRRPILAGAFLSLTLIKPHLLFLVWLAMLFWTWQQRHWKVLASTALCTALLTGGALLLDPHALRQYWQLSTGIYMQAYASGTAALVRKLAGFEGTFWIQLVPTFFGLIWFVFYWRKHRLQWCWVEHMPMLLTVSVLTSPYGWLFDQTLLALPIIALAGWRANAESKIPMNLVVWYTALNCVVMLLMAIPSLALIPAPIFLVALLKREARLKESMIPV